MTHYDRSVIAYKDGVIGYLSTRDETFVNEEYLATTEDEQLLVSRYQEMPDTKERVDEILYAVPNHLPRSTTIALR